MNSKYVEGIFPMFGFLLKVLRKFQITLVYMQKTLQKMKLQKKVARTPKKMA